MGCHGILWILKSYIFPDRQWEKSTPVWYGIGIWLFLSLYWMSPYIISSGIHFIPFYIDAKKRLRLINDIHVDFCDILANKEFDYNLFFQLLL